MVEFLQLLAPLSMRELNKSQLGRDIGMTPPTANRWLQVLEASFFHEIKAVITSSLLNARLYHWRASQREVDLVVEYGGKLFAFECNWNATLRGDEHRDLMRFREEYGEKVAFSAVVTSTGTFRELDNGIYQIPWISL